MAAGLTEDDGAAPDSRRSELVRTTSRRAAVVFGLTSVAVAQPLLDLFGRNPQFFIAGNYSDGQIVIFALLITFVPPVVAISAIAVASAIDRRLGTAVFGITVGVLAGAIALAVFRVLGVERDAVVILLTALIAIGAALLVLNKRPAQLFVSYLAAANLLFLGVFMFASPTAALLGDGAAGDLGRVDVDRPEGPVVVVILDELPAATLMRADGSMNSDRFPGFAELASVSTWFRNASSRYANTHFAVPAILTGRVGAKGALPTYGDQPRNIFTLLGNEVPVTRYEIVSDMCPPTICAPPPRQSLRQALEDATVVYGHRMLPADLRGSLPDISQSWGGYGSDGGGNDGDSNETASIDGSGGDQSEWSGDTDAERAYAKWRHLDRTEKTAYTQAAILREQIAEIDGSPALHVIHVALPHGPWMLNRSGYRSTFVPDLPKSPGTASDEFAVRQQYQLHSMQVGAADAIVSEMIDHLQATGAWDETTLVVLGDHGTSFSLPDIWRKITDANREEVYRMGMFIKAPGQTEDEIRDDPAQTIDVVPSIADLLDARTDWEFDGHSLYDGSAAHTDPRVSEDVEAIVDVAERRAQWFPNGDDWIGLAAIGDNGDLVGTEVDDHERGDPSSYRVRLDRPDVLESLPWSDGRMPYVVAGTVTSNGGDEPPELLVAVNGRLAGVAGGYERDGDAWEFTAYVADFYRPGANGVELFEVERAGAGDSADDVTLHPVGG